LRQRAVTGNIHLTLSPCCCSLCRSSRHADGLFTSGYSRLLSQLTAKDYLESLMDKRVNGDLTENQFPVKRHSDAIFTDSYSRFRNQMAARKYLNSMLQGKRSLISESKLLTGGSVNGCLSLCVGPVTGWRPVQGVPRLSPYNSWERLQALRDP
uniref:Glucagon / GIP / secretin / VIP family domain-containing protein n=1 Tax=Amphilophus citrinellus TaxID=61819 RepID=A0A3Q0RTY6_AMPCI